MMNIKKEEDMLLIDFFNLQRCRTVTKDESQAKSLVARIRNHLTIDHTNLYGKHGFALIIIRDLVQYGRARLLTRRNIGEKTVQKIEKMLTDANITLNP